MKLDTLSNITKATRTYSPEVILPIGVVNMISSVILSAKRMQPEIYKILYHRTHNHYYKIRYIQLTHTNNWLKMHGYPMNRKLISKRKS